jgi:L-lactate utilization protein LutC
MQTAKAGVSKLLTRHQMLQRIRAALGRQDEDEASVPGDLTSLPDLGAVLPPISPENLICTFEEELKKVGGCTYRATCRAEITPILEQILKSGAQTGPDRSEQIVLSRNPLLARLEIKEIIETLGLRAWVWPGEAGRALGAEQEHGYRERCFTAGAGVTGVDFALAESGSLVLTSRTEGSQLSSLAPPVHIAFYLPSQVVGSLEEVLASLPLPGTTAGDADGRSVVFVTGTSRTADIEQILIRGVHGPREVHAILVG